MCAWSVTVSENLCHSDPLKKFCSRIADENSLYLYILFDGFDLQFLWFDDRMNKFGGCLDIYGQY